MREEEIVKELAEMEKDENLTSTEKKTYLSIYGAELEELNNMHRNFLRSIDRKYMNLEDKLSSILDSEVFNFLENPNKYKEQKEFDDMFAKESKKINELDIGAKEKGMLRNILLETIRYGKSYGTMYEQFDDKLEYVNQRISELSNDKTM